MEEWIKLIDEKPIKEGIYKCLFFSEYGTRWCTQYLDYDSSHGFQPIAEEIYVGELNMNVTYWLKINEPPLPISESEKLVITTEVFFNKIEDGHDVVEWFAESVNIPIYEKMANAKSYDITNANEFDLLTMRTIFKSNGTHLNVMK